MRRRSLIVAGLGAGAGVALGRFGTAQASTFPEAGKPLRWIVPFPPGGPRTCVPARSPSA